VCVCVCVCMCVCVARQAALAVVASGLGPFFAVDGPWVRLPPAAQRAALELAFYLPGTGPGLTVALAPSLRGTHHRECVSE
jgi:hypothetical protein